MSLQEISDAELDALEKRMLSEFFEYASKQDRYRWLHWNMRDSIYGFQALVQRARTLGIDKEKCIPPSEEVRVDLSEILHDIYSGKFADHPRLASLIELNNFSIRNFLAGADEAKAFVEGDFVSLHYSTLRKVNIFAEILNHQIDGLLRTNATKNDIYGNWFAAFVNFLGSHWIISLISTAGALFALWQTIWSSAGTQAQ